MCPPRLAPAGGGAGGRSRDRALPGPDPRAALPAARSLEGWPRCRSPPADIESNDRVELRAALTGGEAALRPPRRFRRRLHAGSGRGGLRRRSRHPAVAGREEPGALHERALLDARDGPRVREGSARRVQRARLVCAGGKPITSWNSQPAHGSGSRRATVGASAIFRTSSTTFERRWRGWGKKVPGSELDLLLSVSELWRFRGGWGEWLRWADDALARTETERNGRRADVLISAAGFANLLGDPTRAESYAVEGLAVARHLEAPSTSRRL